MLGWTPKGETNGLSTLNVQKAYQIDVGDTVSVFCGRREKISIIHNNNQTENLVYSEDKFSTKFNTLQIVENYPLPPPEILRRGANTKYA